MSEHRPSGEAARLLKHPMLVAMFDQHEKDAMERAINAPVGDDETRRAATGEVRAIRSVRQKLALAAEGRVRLPNDPGA